jgi:hypothetical protein
MGCGSGLGLFLWCMRYVCIRKHLCKGLYSLEETGQKRNKSKNKKILKFFQIGTVQVENRWRFQIPKPLYLALLHDNVLLIFGFQFTSLLM